MLKHQKHTFFGFVTWIQYDFLPEFFQTFFGLWRSSRSVAGPKIRKLYNFHSTERNSQRKAKFLNVPMFSINAMKLKFLTKRAIFAMVPMFIATLLYMVITTSATEWWCYYYSFSAWEYLDGC